MAEARSAGVIAIIAVGSDYRSNQQVLELASKHRGLVYPALGLHPWNLRAPRLEKSLQFIDDHLDDAVAVGEVGLDYHKKVRQEAPKELQQPVLRQVLGLAKAHGKPALLHTRYAWRDALDLVLEARIERAVFHWYTGTSGVLHDLVAHGYYVSATPSVEYHAEHRRAVKEVPADRLLLETDSPVTYGRGTPGEFTARPADVVRSLRGAAALRGVGEEELARVTTENALRLFGLQPLA